MRIQLTKITLAVGITLAMVFTLTSCGPSAAEVAVRSAPSVDAVKGLKDKLIWLQGNAQSGGNYVLEIDDDEKDINCGMFSMPCNMLYYIDKNKNEIKNNITITMKGIGANRTIHSDFSVVQGVTLILDDNITIKGTINVLGSDVNKFGALVMNEGSTITGVTKKNGTPDQYEIYGAGVIVSDGGTFTMKGGTISGNTIELHKYSLQEVQRYVKQQEEARAAGAALVGKANKSMANRANEAASNNASTARIDTVSGRGAGVYVGPNGTFTKTGGTITGYSDNSANGNVIKSDDGKVMNGHGHAIFFDGKEKKAIDITVGPEVALSFSNGIFSESRSEPKEATAEQEEATAPSDVPAEAQPQD